MKIKRLEGARWLIWTVVIIVATGVFLVTYIISSDNDYSTGVTITHRPKLTNNQTLKIK